MNKDIYFLTAGELPSTSGLHASQIMEPASHFAKLGNRVHWIAVIPLISFIKSIILGANKLSEVKKRCEKLNIDFFTILTIWRFNDPILFTFRKFFLRQNAKQIKKKLQFSVGDTVVIHGRSYYATQIAIYLSELLNIKRRCVVSFDMRSLAPGEMPLTRGFAGYLYYGFYKKWEYDLISQSDISFLPLKSGCEQIKKETGLDVTYAPIQGFDREVDYAPDFDERWANKFAGYSGSFGAYQSPGLLKEMLYKIKGANSFFATPYNEALNGCHCITLPFSEMKNYYKKLLFLIIPGENVKDDYFKTLKMRTNFFSTKASEALSLGVPLFVSSHLTELASFIEQHECGIIYDPESKKIIYPADLDSLDEAFWRRLTKNAFAAGKEFTRENVLYIYMDSWDRLTAPKMGRIKCIDQT